jgi:hypothetical protein
MTSEDLSEWTSSSDKEKWLAAQEVEWSAKSDRLLEVVREGDSAKVEEALIHLGIILPDSRILDLLPFFEPTERGWLAAISFLGVLSAMETPVTPAVKGAYLEVRGRLTQEYKGLQVTLATLDLVLDGPVSSDLHKLTTAFSQLRENLRQLDPSPNCFYGLKRLEGFLERESNLHPELLARVRELKLANYLYLE